MNSNDKSKCGHIYYNIKGASKFIPENLDNSDESIEIKINANPGQGTIVNSDHTPPEIEIILNGPKFGKAVLVLTTEQAFDMSNSLEELAKKIR